MNTHYCGLRKDPKEGKGGRRFPINVILVFFFDVNLKHHHIPGISVSRIIKIHSLRIVMVFTSFSPVSRFFSAARLKIYINWLHKFSRSFYNFQSYSEIKSITVSLSTLRTPKSRQILGITRVE